jgi:transposase
VSELFGQTDRNIMNLLRSSDENLTQKDIEACLRGKLKSKGAELYRAVKGFFEDHHRWLLNEMLERIDHVAEQIARVHSRIRDMLSSQEELINRLIQMPGISFASAYAILSEIGTTIASFATAAALCSWVGVCPGNNQSAGKRHTGT